LSLLKAMLDTNIVSAILRDQSGPAAQRLMGFGIDRVCISIITAAEIRFGFANRPSPRLKQNLDVLFETLSILPFAAGGDEHYADIRADLVKAGQPIGPNDLFIAAHARSLDLTLVTDNVSEFSRVPNLRVENWLD
jgi:tRNA(fMet)-specific endonuclease VapC